MALESDGYGGGSRRLKFSGTKVTAQTRVEAGAAIT
jgi:hypothetical protein